MNKIQEERLATIRRGHGIKQKIAEGKFSEISEDDMCFLTSFTYARTVDDLLKIVQDLEDQLEDYEIVLEQIAEYNPFLGKNVLDEGSMARGADSILNNYDIFVNVKKSDKSI